MTRSLNLGAAPRHIWAPIPGGGCPHPAAPNQRQPRRPTHLASALDQGNGVFDVLDNCPTVANPTQDDTLGNGVGDACRLFANITAPSGDTTLIAGESLAFAAATSGTPAVAPLSVQWSFGGAAPDSSELSPGTVLFGEPGTYTVTLIGLDGNGAPRPPCP